MIQKREIASTILLTIITCGIYGIYWFIKINDEVNELADDRSAISGGVAFLFSILTCGIYTYYWMYKMGEKLDCISVKNGGMSQSRGILYLLLSILGLGIISFALMQDVINKSIISFND